MALETEEELDFFNLSIPGRRALGAEILVEAMRACGVLLKGTGQTSLSTSTGDGVLFAAMTFDAQKSNALRAALDSVLTPLEASVEKEALYQRNTLLLARIAELEAHIASLSEEVDNAE